LHRLFLACLVWLALAGAAAAAERVALVIGNGDYAHAPGLPNAAPDARAMAEAMRKIGFEVFEGIDLDHDGVRDLVRRFAYALDEAELALFFYAGHGLQVDGENYILPVDAELQQELDLAFEALPFSQITEVIERKDRTAILILDACRDNPFVPRISRTLSRSRAVGQGLAEISPGLGTLVIFATDPGKVAYDGQGEHSPFTDAFLRYVDTPGLEIRQLMTRVRRDVLESTDGLQRPWDNSSLLRDVYLVPAAVTAEVPAATEQTAPAPPPVPGATDEQRYWDGVQSIEDPALKAQALEAYLGEFPQGRFRTLAELQARALTAGDKSAEGASPAPVETAALAEPDEAKARVLTPATGESAAASPEEETTPGSSPAELGEIALDLDRTTIRAVQEQLNRLGHAVGRPDGVIGPRTRAALEAFQSGKGLAATGYLDQATIDGLRQAVAALPPPAPPTREPATPSRSESRPAAASTREPPPGTMVACRGPSDPAWVDYRLITLADCKRIGGRWTLP
jgi:Caspase domain/Putative peptidoglycan binding domain